MLGVVGAQYYGWIMRRICLARVFVIVCMCWLWRFRLWSQVCVDVVCGWCCGFAILSGTYVWTMWCVCFHNCVYWLWGSMLFDNAYGHIVCLLCCGRLIVCVDYVMCVFKVFMQCWLWRIRFWWIQTCVDFLCCVLRGFVFIISGSVMCHVQTLCVVISCGVLS